MTNFIILFSIIFNSIVSKTIKTNGIPLGYIVIAVIGTPVVILISAALMGNPRKPKITGLFIGWLLMMFTAFVGAVYVLGAILGFFY
jgi:hypothetical protein